MLTDFRITSGNPRQFNYRDESIQNNKKYCLQLFKSSHFLCEDFFCFLKNNPLKIIPFWIFSAY